MIFGETKGAVYSETAKANEERILVLRANPRNLYVGEKIYLEPFIVNELDNFSGDLIFSLESEDGTKFWNKNENIKVNHGINIFEKIAIPSDELMGKYFIKGTLKNKREKLFMNLKFLSIFLIVHLLRPKKTYMF